MKPKKREVKRSTNFLNFCFGNPAVEVVRGVIEFAEPLNQNQQSKNTNTIQSESSQIIKKDNQANIICGLRIPAHIAISELCVYIACYRKNITHIQILRDSSCDKKFSCESSQTSDSLKDSRLKSNMEKTSDNDVKTSSSEMKYIYPKLPSSLNPLESQIDSNYICLFHFKTSTIAEAFYNDFQSKRYNSVEQYTFCLKFVKKVKYEDDRSFPPKPNDSSYPPKTNEKMTHYNISKKNTNSNTNTNTKESKISLYTCPVCLDHINPQQSCLITILCNHIFHLECLSKWIDSTCPVCRYHIQPSYRSYCSICKLTTGLRLCLICGYIGCNSHSFEHFHHSGHTFALEIESKEVWDFIRKGYVHRLIQAASDGKPIEYDFDHKSKGLGLNSPRIAVVSKKLEGLISEYNRLLSSQLEQQYSFYQRQLRMLRADEQKAIDKLEKKITIQKIEIKAISTKINSYNNNIDNLLKKLKKTQKKVDTLNKQYDNLQSLNVKLTSSQTNLRNELGNIDDFWEKKIKKMDENIKQVRENIQDMKLYLTTSNKINKLQTKGEQGEKISQDNEKDPICFINIVEKEKNKRT